MKNEYHESHIMKSVDKVGFKETDKMVGDYPKLEAENEELKLKCEKFESEKQELRAENAIQKQLIDVQQQLIESKNETIDALKRESDMKDRIIEILTEERHRDEEKEHSKSCLGLE
ncbi:hypothetical protein EWZ95_07745 [Helicobacter pylori]|uniref:hypothetical protein n=1 Tax=Helicobacter pylori TaxID=210 RepID=UPI0011CD2696|nr:hypothetical protein [Helicobacter pylori]NHA86761.1 hypothetical protein [Helicobacter pylori]NHA90090.1 hypothetical protein [Helicobacter pylori]QEF23524.1 hypothetical protein D2C85_01265 [Helicobacter pylori]